MESFRKILTLHRTLSSIVLHGAGRNLNLVTFWWPYYYLRYLQDNFSLETGNFKREKRLKFWKKFSNTSLDKKNFKNCYNQGTPAARTPCQTPRGSFGVRPRTDGQATENSLIWYWKLNFDANEEYYGDLPLDYHALI